ncbi:unnamed protein product [Macrosiphum euphorbiae]|uniref:Death-associated inhibitor of apoptosis 1-like n=1 Tax=Macrosiphum euphorbiae TaxID=13131 RepID=A0AAV0W955_9HEMI|nr:unnamed protein product [Macrosiphum euphorbiae]
MNLLKYSTDFQSLVHSVEENSDPEYPMYSSFLSRLKTYDSRSPQSYQDKYSLAQCGFTYTGTDDLVQCYYCGLLLGKWEKNDEPWSQHALHNPKCIFILLYKGVQFIENVKNEYIDNNRVSSSKSESYDTID